MRVLVIDDEADIAEIVRLTFGLRWPEAEVVTASTGEMGVELVERDAPDLVLLDIGLPDIDGFELCERIRHFSDVPIVILFARHEEVDKVRGLELGADDYVTKPFSHIELLARVRAVMRRSESQRVLSAVGYPEGWAKNAPVLPSTPQSESTMARDREPHPWVEPLGVRRGKRPWVARIPITSNGEVIGLLLLVARKRGALCDPVVRFTIATQGSARRWTTRRSTRPPISASATSSGRTSGGATS